MQKLAEELKVTYRDILTLGESNRRIELFDGEVIMTAMPSILHQIVAKEVSAMIDRHVKKRNLGLVLPNPVDVVLSEHVQFQPDVTYLSRGRFAINDGQRYNGAPDLVVEILSESTEERDRTFKFREYARGGALEYWLVSPEKKEIEVYTNSDKGFRLVKIFSNQERMSTPLFPDAQFELREVFP